MATRVDRARLRRHGQATYRLIRYVDDFVVMVSGTEGLRDQAAASSPPWSTMGLRLSEEKTSVVHIASIKAKFKTISKRERTTRSTTSYAA